MKYSIRNLIVAATTLVSGLVIGGCQGVGNIPPDQLDETPIAVDPAMAYRDWEPVTVTYAATGIYGMPTLNTWQTKSDQPEWEWLYSLSETPIFFANVLLMPVQIFLEPVWKDNEFRAATIPPSYSAMPVLPPSSEEEYAAPPASEEQPQPDAPATPPERPADQPAPEPRGY